MTDQDEHGRREGARSRAPIESRPAPTRAALVVPEVKGHATSHSTEARKDEFEGLARAIDLDIVSSEIVKVREVRPATFLGAGQVEALARRVKDEEIDLVI